MPAPGATALVALVVVSVGITVAARLRARRTAIDYYLAGQRVGIVTNACAICGDYLSAASFLGVAAAVYSSGLDGLWYAAGFAAGFVPVALFTAAPLRRFGQHSLPDFLAKRFDSERVRALAVVVVELVILAYLIPQAVGSGLTWSLLVDKGVLGLSPYATGVLVVSAGVAALVLVGGMRGTTWNQALQFLLLLATLVWLTVVVVGAGFSYGGAVDELNDETLTAPVVLDDGSEELAPVHNQLDPDAPSRFGEAGARYGPLGQFALVLALVLGTAGLPHVVNRFFTSPSGRAARRTTVWVVGLAGAFYALAVLLGTAARSIVPGAVGEHGWLEPLTVDGVLRVPEHAMLVLGRIYGGTGGLAVVATGALIAILSTIGGLLLAAASSWGQDIYARHVNPAASERQALRAGRVAVVIATSGSAAVALVLRPDELADTVTAPSLVATMVTWAFCLAGSSLTPVLLLAIWWRGATARGALAGMVVGMVVALTLIGLGIASGEGVSARASLLLTPTIVAAPMAAAATVLVSRRGVPPADLDWVWRRMHGTAADRHAERLAQLTLEQAR
jgi:cation/acetate symporter